jgi:hypothetical protein
MSTITFAILWLTFNIGPLGLIGLGAIIGAGAASALQRGGSAA